MRAREDDTAHSARACVMQAQTHGVRFSDARCSAVYPPLSEPECLQLDKHMAVVAAKFRAVKFCKIRAQEAIHNFPNHKCPTLLIYHNSHIIKQIEKLGAFGGSARISPASIEWVLAQPFTVRPAGAQEDMTHTILRTEMKENPLNVANKLNLLQKKKAKGYSSDEASDEDD